MPYISTRGTHAPVDFMRVLQAGLAPDGGLYMPVQWPKLTPQQAKDLGSVPYAEAAFRILRPFVEGAFSDTVLKNLLEEAYADFEPVLVPAGDLWLLELFHGPTYAFKDMAMQVLGRFFSLLYQKNSQPMVVVGATSGDTGASAIKALRHTDGTDVFILYPHGRISETQRRQMTTAPEDHIHAIAIKGDFDDCQALVKGLFNDQIFCREMCLVGVNSINWARIMAQIVYYFTAAASFSEPVAFTVPTGNFGDIFAGFGATQMGLAVSRLVIATNTNDILARFLETGHYTPAPVSPTLSPSMDIQVSSNFERLLFEATGRNPEAVQTLMHSLQHHGSFVLEGAPLRYIRERFDAQRVDEDETYAAIADCYKRTGRLIDPHTAVGWAAAQKSRQTPMVVLATAHPAKFPETVKKATHHEPTPPPALAQLAKKQEKYVTLPKNLAAVQAFIREHAR